MRKSNIALMALALVVSIALLWLWFYMGFNQIDSPLDLLVAVLWWVVIGGASVLMYRMEKQRQEQRRTAFVAPGFVFNPETGARTVDAEKPMVQVLQDVLEGLKYDFQIQDAPEGCKEGITHVVRSKTFKVQDAQNDADSASAKQVVEWTGEVVLVGQPDQQPKPFGSKEELAALLA